MFNCRRLGCYCSSQLRGVFWYSGGTCFENYRSRVLGRKTHKDDRNAVECFEEALRTVPWAMKKIRMALAQDRVVKFSEKEEDVLLRLGVLGYLIVQDTDKSPNDVSKGELLLQEEFVILFKRMSLSQMSEYASALSEGTIPPSGVRLTEGVDISDDEVAAVAS
jgi:hypothetical protein